jgi:acyl carrier protein
MHMEVPPLTGKELGGGPHGRSREALELAISQVWKEVFQREQIDRDDNFFELGGNSLLGMDITELLANRLAIHIPVLALFQYPTIREISELVAADEESGE